MVARSDATAAPAEGILDTTTEPFWEHPSDQTRPDKGAARAGVTMQTVIRRFGSKEKLFAALERQSEQVRGTRAPVLPGDNPGALAHLVEDYEFTGRRVPRTLAEEERIPALKVRQTRGAAYTGIGATAPLNCSCRNITVPPVTGEGRSWSLSAASTHESC